MTAIYKKELKSYLTSMIGYLFMAFTLALFGLYFTAINLQQGYPEIGYALQNSAFILLIAVPVLTMRVLSEEQKNKTERGVGYADIYEALLSCYYGSLRGGDLSGRDPSVETERAGAFLVGRAGSGGKRCEKCGNL